MPAIVALLVLSGAIVVIQSLLAVRYWALAAERQVHFPVGDGVLTDTGVYYSEHGEAMKRFSIRDGMGVERLRTQCGIETAIMTGEGSGSVIRRAEKLSIKNLFLNAKDKRTLLS